MRAVATVALMLVRLTGLALLVLGVLFWTGRATGLVPLHMLLGMLLVLGLWTLAIVGFGGKAGAGRAVAALVWGLVVAGLGFSQTRLVPGSAHWTIRVLHLLVGLAAMGQAEGLAAHLRRGRPAAPPA